MIMNLTILTILCLLVKVISDEKTKCYVLALEGGAARGAYAAGAIKAFVENVPDSELQWDVVTGISIGSMNAAMLSTFEKGEEKEASDYIEYIWLNISKNDIYTNWWFGQTGAFFFKSSLFDISPSQNTFERVFKGKELKRNFVCGAVNLETGEYDTWNKNNLNTDNYQKAILSSTAVPVAFPPNQFNGKYYIDGGWRSMIDVTSGIQQCLEMGYAEKDITLDVIMLSQKKVNAIDPRNLSPLQAYNRAQDLMWYGLSMANLEEALVYFPEIHWRYVVVPTMILPFGQDVYEFRKEDIENMIKWGKEDAKNVVDKGPGVNFKEKLNIYRESRKNMWSRPKNYH